MNVKIVTDWAFWEALFPSEVIAIMRACVSRDETRYALTMPFSRDGIAYATDGRVLVAWPADLVDCGCHENLPDAEEVLRPKLFDSVTEWIHSSKLGIPSDPKKVCGTCGGGSIVNCPMCGHPHDGEDCYDGYEIDFSKQEIFPGKIYRNCLLRKLGPDFSIGRLVWPPDGAAFLKLPHGGMGRLCQVRKVVV